MQGDDHRTGRVAGGVGDLVDVGRDLPVAMAGDGGVDQHDAQSRDVADLHRVERRRVEPGQGQSLGDRDRRSGAADRLTREPAGATPGTLVPVTRSWLPGVAMTGIAGVGDQATEALPSPRPGRRR